MNKEDDRVTLAVLKDRFDRMEKMVEKGFSKTEEVIWSIKNDMKTVYQEHEKSDQERFGVIHHDLNGTDEEPGIKQKIIIFNEGLDDIKTKIKYAPYIIAAFIVGATMTSKGFDKAISVFDKLVLTMAAQ